MGKWFTFKGAKGDRTLAQQLVGLDQLWPRVFGRKVLDVGCAEGLIALECCKSGASLVTGLELRSDAVRLANKGPESDFTAFCVDVNDHQTTAGAYDVVLLLAILHKLRDPSARFEHYLRAATELCVVRLPHDDWPVLRDARSGNKPHDLAAVAKRCGWRLDLVTEGPTVDGNPPEWVGFFVRDEP